MVEVALTTAAVLLDLAIPTLVILVLAGGSLVVRRTGPATLGFRRLDRPARTLGVVLGLTAGWTLVQIGLVMPLLNRLTGTRQDLSGFDDLEGDVGLLVVLLVLSWTLAAVGEETAFRGYLPTRIVEAGGGAVAGVLGSSVLFALIHTEQGLVGVLVTFLDALFLSYLCRRQGGLWAAVLGHGLNNTIGLVAFFLVGPVYGLW